MLPPLKLDRAEFLAKYWQKEAVLLRAAIDPRLYPLSAEELAGLAMEDDIESRIVSTNNGQWIQRHGPFETQDFQQSGSWTLLVQAVDHYLPGIADLRGLVDFVPEWRMDDIMVSYGTDGSSVGPHYDNYDVFLLQGTGKKRWRVGQRCSPEEPLLPHEELRILQTFDTQKDYLLEPGDVLYVPPGVAHWGIAVGESMTFSIGFRAPRITDMAARWLDNKLASFEADRFFTDAGRSTSVCPGEISSEDITRARAQLLAALDDPASTDLWFGELATEPRYDPQPSEEDVATSRAALSSDTACAQRISGAKLAWSESPTAVAAYSNGHAALFPSTTLPYLKALCAQNHLELDMLHGSMKNDGVIELIEFLVQTGSIYVE